MTKVHKRTPLNGVLKAYCENTTAHGFQYWISARSVAEKLLWVAIVLIGFATALISVSAAITQWIRFPTQMAIATHSMPATEVPYPAVTVCNPNGYDAGEYLRAVFDNFQYSCEEGSTDCGKSGMLRSHFPAYDAGSEEVTNFYIRLCASSVENL